MTFTEQEVSILEEGIESIYIEEKVSVNSDELKKLGIFSKSFCTGISIAINDGIGYDRTLAWGKNQVRSHNNRQYNECLNGYKVQGLK